MQKLENLLSEIKQIVELNKTNPDTRVTHKLSKLRLELRLLLLEQYDKQLTSLKLSHYSSGNRAGKFLAQRLNTHKAQTKINHLIHPVDKSKIMNPKEIANSFADYYYSLYNLSEDLGTIQPISGAIQQFLDTVNLPSLSRLLKLLRIYPMLNLLDRMV